MLDELSRKIRVSSGHLFRNLICDRPTYPALSLEKNRADRQKTAGPVDFTRRNAMEPYYSPIG